ncbi:ATP-binding protein [Shimia sp. SDUM112013]|uniref:hybrid sensor histidine kinase/response regulator n=1 Tax=Shimia sp. SDUM112013 TaxID=3136160 RepID=UPI0032ED60BB
MPETSHTGLPARAITVGVTLLILCLGLGMAWWMAEIRPVSPFLALAAGGVVTAALWGGIRAVYGRLLGLLGDLSDAGVQVWVTNGQGRKLGSGPDPGQFSLAFDARDTTQILSEARAGVSALRTGLGPEARQCLQVVSVGLGLFLWRLQTVMPVSEDRSETGLDHLPHFVLARDGSPIYLNAAARRLFGSHPPTIPETEPPGAPVFIETAARPVQCLVSRVALPEGRKAVFLVPLDPGQSDREAIGFEDLPVALLKVARAGQVLGANKAARAMLANETVEGLQLHDLMEGLGRSINDWLAEAASGLGDSHTEFLVLRRADREVFVQVSLTRVIDDEGVALMAVLTDATELKSLEAQFVQSQKMQAIGQLAGGVAHDFNNLLTAITGHCDLLLMRHDPSDQDYADLVQINQNANRAAALVGQLLAFSRKQNLRPEVLDLRNTLADLTHLLNRLVGERIRLTLCHDPDLRSVRADKRQLEQVLMNLVVNARDAMPDGGEIVIETESMTYADPVRRDRATVPAGDYVCVRVKDQGTGIAPDKLQKVFEPFYTTKRTGEGTGLGLSTAYGIVKQTGGYIFVDSTPGAGTVFSLLFPVHEVYEAAAPPVPELPEHPVRHVDGGVLLLVEDEAPVRSFACRALRLKGLTVLEAASGEEALEILEDPALGVDLFVSDVVMPGLDGPGWVTQALQSRPDVPVVFMSGYAEDSFSDRQAEIPHTAFLQKPFSLNDLTQTVQTMLQEVQERES